MSCEISEAGDAHTWICKETKEFCNGTDTEEKPNEVQQEQVQGPAPGEE